MSSKNVRQHPIRLRQRGIERIADDDGPAVVQRQHPEFHGEQFRNGNAMAESATRGPSGDLPRLTPVGKAPRRRAFFRSHLD